MSRILDTSRASEIAEAMISTLADEGYSGEEIIPGFIRGVILIARMTTTEEAYLDEAANLLADGERWGYGI